MSHNKGRLGKSTYILVSLVNSYFLCCSNLKGGGTNLGNLSLFLSRYTKPAVPIIIKIIDINCAASYTEYDVVDGDEDQLDDVADEPDHDEAHGACLQDLHVLYNSSHL